ncbi:MAG: Fic family protein [Myxococcota bacterium]
MEARTQGVAMELKRDQHRDIDDRTEELRDLALQHPDVWKDFLERFELGWIFHENALEGVVVTHQEMITALEGRPIAQDTYPAIRNFRLAMDLIRTRAAEGGPVNMALVRELHAVLGSHDPNYQVARYRKDIPLHRTYFHDIAQPHDIVSRLEKLMSWAESSDPDDDDAVAFAAHLHHEFMSIFPFAENSGKTGRLLVNFVLLRHGYLPVVFHATDRQRYYDTLRLSKKEAELLLRDTMSNTIENGSTFIAKVMEERAKKRPGRHLTAV